MYDSKGRNTQRRSFWKFVIINLFFRILKATNSINFFLSKRELFLLKQLINIFSDVSLSAFVQHIYEADKHKVPRRQKNEKKLLNEFEEVIISGVVDDSEPDEDFENVDDIELETLKERLDSPLK